MVTREELDYRAEQVAKLQAMVDAAPSVDVAYIGRCKACKQTTRIVVTLPRYVRLEREPRIARYEDASRFPDAPCGCHLGAKRWQGWAEIVGTYRPEVTCGARCTNAIGPSCDCSCAGAAHGAGHG